MNKENDMDERPRLKPVIYVQNYFKKGSQNTSQQMFLLKALQVTQDPKKLKAMMGVKSVAEVYRTLDKLAMRKEYHEALSRAGISFDFIAKGIKELAVSAEKDDTKLKAFVALLKSVGMDMYKEGATATTGTWEETLLKKIEEGKSNPALLKEGKKVYDVEAPQIPASARIAEEDEDELTSSIYNNK